MVETPQILRKLQRHYNLKEKEILIIKALRYHHSKADAICKTTKIPVGRVYSYLNNLVNLGLIERTSKKPYIYEVKDFNKNIINFMKSSRDKLLRREAEIMRLMRGPSSEHIETLDTKEQFTQYHLNILSEGEHIRIVCVSDSFPFLLYPDDWEDFQKMRRLITSKRSTISFTDDETSYLVYRSYQEAINKNKKFEVIMGKAAFTKHMKILKEGFGKEQVDQFIQTIKQKIKAKPINIYLLDEDITMQVDINENRVGLSLRHENTTFGIVIFSKKVVQIYKTSFQQKKLRATPLIEYLQSKFSNTQ